MRNRLSPTRLRKRSPLLGIELLEGRDVPATFAVNSLADAGIGSLRSAIDLANAAPDADTIVFAGAAAGGTVNLSTFTNTTARDRTQ